MRARVIGSIITGLGYLLIFARWGQPDELSLAALSAIPVAWIGLSFGLWAGAGFALAFVAANVLLLNSMGIEDSGLVVMLRGAGFPNTLGTLAMGTGAGIIHEFAWRWVAAVERGQQLSDEIHERNRQLKIAFDSVEKRNSDLRLLNQIVAKISSQLELDELFPAIVGLAAQLVDAESVSIVLPDPEKRELIIQASVDGASGYRMAWGTGIIGRVMISGQPELVPEIAADRRYHVEMESSSGVKLRDGLFSPIKVADEILGVISAVNSKNGGFDLEKMEMLDVLSYQAGIAIQNGRLFRSERELKHQADGLRQTSLMLASQLGVEELLERLLIYLIGVVDYNSAAIFLRVDGELICVAARDKDQRLDPDSIRLGLANAILDRIRLTARPYIVADMQQDERVQPNGQLDQSRAWMGIPLNANGELWVT